jgi:DNA-binding response OmpR family regulator
MPRILLIDDDRLVRTTVARALIKAGHEVIQATDGREGVDLTRVSRFDLVITDLIMPGQEGVETITILRKEQPQLPVIAISGGLPNTALYLEIARKIGAKRVLAKPFTTEELLAVIAEVLPDPARPPPKDTDSS